MSMRKKKVGRKSLPPKQLAKNQAACRERWLKANTKIFNIRLNKTTDILIINKIEEQENKSAYIKQLILKDIKKEGNS